MKKLFCVHVGCLTGVDEHHVAVDFTEFHTNEHISPEKVKKLIEKEFVEKKIKHIRVKTTEKTLS